MRLSLPLSTAFVAFAIAAPAVAAGISPVVNVSTESANDLRGLAYGPDGKIYVAGHVGASNEDARTAVGRFNADGTPDSSFGENGFTTVDLAPGRQEQTLAVAVLGNGDVVLPVTAVDEDEGQSVYLVRFDAAGKQLLGPDWGDAEGKVEVVLGWANADNDTFPEFEKPPVDTAWDLKRDTSGGGESLVLFAMGSAPNGSGRTDNDRYVVRLSAADGYFPVTEFNGGKPFSYHSTGTFADNARRGAVEAANGKIMFAGYSNLGDVGTHVVLIRLNPDGTPDESFGNYVEPASSSAAVGLPPQPGVAVFNPFAADGGFAECYAVAKLADGSYVTTGYGAATGKGAASSLGYESSVGPDLVSFRATATGLAGDWGNAGTQAIQSEGKAQPTAEERSRMVVGLPDGRTVHVGRYGGNGAAYVLTPEGQLECSSGDHGVIPLGHPSISAQFFNAAVSPDGARIALTTNADPKGARLVVLQVE